jgi:glycolate oxidase
MLYSSSMANEDIITNFRGDLYEDKWTRLVSSVDASHFQIKPLMVAVPEDEMDVSNLCRYAYRKEIPISPRGAGTGLLGQSLTNGIMLDISKHLNRIVEVEENYVVAEPGVIKACLDKELNKRGKFLPPDPSSSNFCSLGGMIANNSSGAHTLGYGSTLDYVEELEVVYPDGMRGKVGGPHPPDNRCRSLLQIVVPNLGLIAVSYPDTSKNSCGYRLDALVRNGSFFPQRVFVASEGTLGIITKAKLRVLNIPSFQVLLILEFADLKSLSESIPRILAFGPSAVELLAYGRFRSEHSYTNEGSLTNFPTLYVEFSGESLTRLEDVSSRCTCVLQQLSMSHRILSDKASCETAWNERRNSLNHILRMTEGSRKPIGIIEDTIVNPSHLGKYIPFIQRIYESHKLEYVMYGHAGNGNFHTRPIIDLQSPLAFEIIEDIAQKVFSRVRELRGSISAEHGDGLARSRYIKDMYGSFAHSLFVQTKKIFDRKNIMNPGKKVVYM